MTLVRRCCLTERRTRTVIELNQLIGVFLLKGGHTLFNINNHLGIDCAREREMDADQSAQALTQKKKQKQKTKI